MAVSIAGAFSLVGLLISKEQRVSDFRQIWIDALRADLAKFVAHAHQIQAYATLNKPIDYSKYWQDTHEDHIELNQASIRIKLRLNPSECDSRLILQSMGEMEELFKTRKDIPDSAALDKINTIVDALEHNAPPLLKKEWNRVKRGEVIYNFAKWGAFTLFILTGLLAYVLWLRLAP